MVLNFGILEENTKSTPSCAYCSYIVSDTDQYDDMTGHLRVAIPVLAVIARWCMFVNFTYWANVAYPSNTYYLVLLNYACICRGTNNATDQLYFTTEIGQENRWCHVACRQHGAMPSA